MRVLATANPTRPPWLSNVPTMPELGFPKSTMTATFGVYGPVNMPADRVAKLSDAFRQALTNPELMATFSATGTEIQAQTAAELKAFTVTEFERYKALVAVSGAKID